MLDDFTILSRTFVRSRPREGRLEDTRPKFSSSTVQMVVGMEVSVCRQKALCKGVLFM